MDEDLREEDYGNESSGNRPTPLVLLLLAVPLLCVGIVIITLVRAALFPTPDPPTITKTSPSFDKKGTPIPTFGSRGDERPFSSQAQAWIRGINPPILSEPNKPLLMGYYALHDEGLKLYLKLADYPPSLSQDEVAAIEYVSDDIEQVEDLKKDDWVITRIPNQPLIQLSGAIHPNMLEQSELRVIFNDTRSRMEFIILWQEGNGAEALHAAHGKFWLIGEAPQFFAAARTCHYSQMRRSEPADCQEQKAMLVGNRPIHLTPIVMYTVNAQDQLDVAIVEGQIQDRWIAGDLGEKTLRLAITEGNAVEALEKNQNRIRDVNSSGLMRGSWQDEQLVVKDLYYWETEFRQVAHFGAAYKPIYLETNKE